MIRTAFLYVPEIDSVASANLRQLLVRYVPGVLILQEEQVGSQRNWVEEILRRWCDEEEFDLVLTIGGAYPAPGPGRGECVPEATLAVGERLVPGVAEAMRSYARQETPLADLHRGVAVIRGRTLLINLPVGAAAALLFLEGAIQLIAPILSYLQEGGTAPTIDAELEILDQSSAEASSSSVATQAMTAEVSSKLDAEEFAAFLQRPRLSPSHP